MEKIPAHTSSIRHAVFLHNSRIASVSDDLTMRIFDRNSGQVINYSLLASKKVDFEKYVLTCIVLMSTDETFFSIICTNIKLNLTN